MEKEEDIILRHRFFRFWEQIATIPRKVIFSYIDDTAFGMVDYPLERDPEKNQKFDWQKDGF